MKIYLILEKFLLYKARGVNVLHAFIAWDIFSHMINMNLINHWSHLENYKVKILFYCFTIQVLCYLKRIRRRNHKKRQGRLFSHHYWEKSLLYSKFYMFMSLDLGNRLFEISSTLASHPFYKLMFTNIKEKKRG